MTASREIEIDRGVRLPGWMMGVVAALLVGAVTAGAAAVVDTRTGQARIEERVAQLEKDTSAGAGVPAQLAVLSSQVGALTRQVEELGHKLDEQQRAHR